jgi:hypothetical protein
VAGVARVSVVGTSAGVNIVNVFHVASVSGSWSQLDVNALATGMRAAFVNRFLSSLSTSYLLNTVTATDLSSINGRTGTATGSTPGTGGTGTSVPNSLAVVVSWQIARHYRGGHPRTYLGALATAILLNQTTFTSTFVSSLQTNANSFLNDVPQIVLPSGTTGFLVAVHRRLNGALLTPPQTSAITGAAVDNRLDTQRRRLGKDR